MVNLGVGEDKRRCGVGGGREGVSISAASLYMYIHVY